MNEINLTQPTISDKSGDSDTIQSMGDDTHIENHISPLCHVDEKTALNNMKQAEPLEKEVARLNSIIERQKAEMVAMQVQIDELTANW